MEHVFWCFLIIGVGIKPLSRAKLRQTLISWWKLYDFALPFCLQGQLRTQKHTYTRSQPVLDFFVRSTFGLLVEMTHRRTSAIIVVAILLKMFTIKYSFA